MPVHFSDLLDAFEFVSASDLDEHQAFLRKETGEIFCKSDVADLDELPDDVDDDAKYIAIPDKRDLDLGKPLVLDFASEFLPNDFDEIRYMFGKKGAYAKFKALLARRGALDRWYSFEEQATERALREWCDLHSIELADDKPERTKRP
jgi:hypothetical protein